MNEPAASDLLNPQPPATPEAAEARRQEMLRDPAFMERVGNKDAAAFDEYNRIWRQARGMTPEPVAAVNVNDVFAESNARALAQTEQHAEGLRNDGFTELQIYQYLNGRPCPLAERQQAERTLANLKADKAFQQRKADGDPAARHEWRRVHVELSMPVGTLEQIQQWEQAHAARAPKS